MCDEYRGPRQARSTSNGPQPRFPAEARTYAYSLLIWWASQMLGSRDPIFCVRSAKPCIVRPGNELCVIRSAVRSPRGCSPPAFAERPEASHPNRRIRLNRL